MLTSKEHLHAQARRITAALFKEKNRNHILRYTRIANRTFGNFFVGIIIDAILITIVTFVALTIFRVPYAILVSVIVGCTNIIPVFGPFIGAIPSAFIIFVKEPSKALVFIILILIIQQIEGNIIAPKILGNSTGVSPLGVIVAIILMGAYLGVIGMIIGVPIFAMILTVCNEIIETRLKANGLPTDTAEYYPAYSLVDPNERHEKLINRIFDTIKNICLKIIKIFKKKSKKVNPDTEKETQNNDERSE
jgi:predicted PurR-regulated permease PerM